MTAYRAGFWLGRRKMEFWSKYSVGSPLWRAAKAGYAHGQSGDIQAWVFSQEELVARAVLFMSKYGAEALAGKIKDPGLIKALHDGFMEINESKPWEKGRKPKK